MKQFSASTKHSILLEYTPHSPTHSFSALAARHGVAGGRSTIQTWHSRWDDTIASLQHKKGAGRPRMLTQQEVLRHIEQPIRRLNRSARRVHYTKVAEQVRQKTHKSVSDRTVQRIGKEQLGAKKVIGKKRTADECKLVHTYCVLLLLMFVRMMLTQSVDDIFVMCAVSADLCEDIAKIRRKIQRIGIKHVLFLDETHKREGDVESHTIVLPGEQSYIQSANTSSYALRFDMIACCSGTTPLPPIIYAPTEREKGVTAQMLLEYIRNLLAQSAGALDVYPLYLYLDRSPIHNEDDIKQEFHDWGCQELVEVIKIPPASAKRLSPLDNSLFNVWRQRVLADGSLTLDNIKQRMSSAWESLSESDIRAQYRHCGLMRGSDVYFDCPDPVAHAH